MNKSKILLMLVAVVLQLQALGQSVTISGTVKDATNGEDLIGATIHLRDYPAIGTSCNEFGYYSLTVPAGTQTLIFEYVGFERLVKEVTEVVDQTLNVSLKPAETSLKEVLVKSERVDKNVSANSMGMFKLDPKKMQAIPVLFGEKDILKVLQLTPGVKPAGDGNAGFYVRGGGADQNLVLLDDAPVYNASHLMGFFSVFNSDAIKEATMHKGGGPAEYGGRGSSVLDIRMRDGNSKKISASGGVGLISSRLTVEGPIVKDRGAFIVSGRRTYADLFRKISSDEATRNARLYFYDLNAKGNYKISDKDRIFISAYFGRDVLTISNTMGGFDWGNSTLTTRWNHVVNSRVFTNTSILYSDYDYLIKLSLNGNPIKVASGIQDFGFKEDITITPNHANTIKVGFNATRHDFRPGKIQSEASKFYNSITFQTRKALEAGIYAQNDMQLSERMGLHYGIRYSYYSLLGPITNNRYDADGNRISTEEVRKGSLTGTYGGFEPRVSFRYSLKPNSSLKMSYNRMNQYIHLLSNSTTSTPIDQWIPTSNNVKPQIVDQLSVGYFRNLRDNMFEVSIEAYYKNMQNQIDYRPAAQLILNENVEGELVYGTGRAYGAEFLLRKQTGKLTGWVGYTLSRSLRKFDAINNGSLYPAHQDRIHDISIVGCYELNPKVTLAANWVYYTGSAATFPKGGYKIDGMQVPYYTERNGYRMPDYHRLDLSVTWFRKKTERMESSWNFSLYNAYGRQNAYTIGFRQNEDNPEKTEAVQTSLFTWVPAVTYNFKF